MVAFSFSSEETIAAIATAVAPGQGGIAVVRISGPAAELTARRVFVCSGHQQWQSHRIMYGHVIDRQNNDERIDEVLLFIMKAPRSFTGEDVVEIQCHAGLITVQRVLELVIKESNVRRALPGEFSQRAVLNGRIDITKAEAISELVSARSRRAAQLAIAGLDGGISSSITTLRNRLLDQLSEIEARVDFEEDLPFLKEDQVLSELQAVKKELEKLVHNAKSGAVLRNGLRVALIGAPNVGKSSLLNRLSCSERAIVTDLPGTTRDLLESEIVLRGVPITLLDTAGIRQTHDEIEQLGIDRSRTALASADVVLLVFDLTIGWRAEEEELFSQIPKDLPTILVGNKVDALSSTFQANQVVSQGDNIVPQIMISALTGQGEKDFIEIILQACGRLESQGLLFALNERQCDLAKLSIDALERSSEVAYQQLPWDFWTIDLREAIHYLGEITGDEITEAVLDRIFSKFCIGK